MNPWRRIGAIGGILGLGWKNGAGLANQDQVQGGDSVRFALGERVRIWAMDPGSGLVASERQGKEGLQTRASCTSGLYTAKNARVRPEAGDTWIGVVLRVCTEMRTRARVAGMEQSATVLVLVATDRIMSRIGCDDVEKQGRQG